MKCELCPESINSVEFENHYTLNGKKFCAVCYTRILKIMNGGMKNKLPGYGKEMKVLEAMVKLKIFKFPTMPTNEIRIKAITQLKKEFPVIFKGYT